jgi:hypothetical protein
MAKNITLTVDEDLLARYRLIAAEQNTSVNALVRRHMEEATGTAARRKQALARLQELSRQSEAYDRAHPVTDDDAGARFSREETYSGRRFRWPRND